jgi:hypothetical protein
MDTVLVHAVCERVYNMFGRYMSRELYLNGIHLELIDLRDAADSQLTFQKECKLRYMDIVLVESYIIDFFFATEKLALFLVTDPVEQVKQKLRLIERYKNECAMIRNDPINGIEFDECILAFLGNDQLEFFSLHFYNEELPTPSSSSS